MLSILNICGLAAYFVALGLSVCYCFSAPRGWARKAASVLVIATTWFFIIRFSVRYVGSDAWENGENLFDLAYADVIWGGSEGNWGLSQSLLAWTIVATVWTAEASAFYQLLGIFGAMSGSFLLITPSVQPSNTISLSYALGALFSFVCVWILPGTSSMVQLRWWLWGLHACLIAPKFFSLKRQVSRAVLYIIVALMALLTHLAAPASPWPATDCRLSITIDAIMCGLLTLVFIYERTGSTAQVFLWTLLMPIVSPGFVLGFFCACEHGAVSSFVTFLQQYVAGLLRNSTKQKSHAPGKWMNLGLWKTTDDYDTACCHLAELVSDAAQLREGDHVLCIGCGCGDELNHLQTRHSLGRIVGLDPHVDVQRFVPSASNVELKQKRAEDMTQGGDRVRHNEFSKILAIDSVYHVDKARLFECCARVLAKGSCMSITDVIVRPGAPWWVQIALSLMNIRVANQWTKEEYANRLSAAGFNVIKFQSLEPHVLAGCGLLPTVLRRHLDYVIVVAESTVVRPTAAVIGSGMSGLVAAHLLQETHEVVIYEAGEQVGLAGLQTVIDGVAIDVPLRITMPSYYSRLYGLFQELGVQVKAVPYNACHLRGDRVTLATSTSWLTHILQHLRYVPYMTKFAFAMCKPALEGETFGAFMHRHRLLDHEAYKIYSLHLSWILSCTYDMVHAAPACVIRDFIMSSNPLVKMWEHSGNMVRVYPSMMTLQDKLLEGKTVKVGTPISSPIGQDRVVEGVAYDVVVLATEAPAAAKLLPSPWREVLQRVSYTPGTIHVHKDARLMPSDRSQWRTYNVNESGPGGACELTIWLNAFWDCEDVKEDLFETWNARQAPMPERLIKEVPLRRCVIDANIQEVWKQIQTMQGKDGIYLCGAYAVEGMGLLEQACRSAQHVAEAVRKNMKKASSGEVTVEANGNGKYSHCAG